MELSVRKYTGIVISFHTDINTMMATVAFTGRINGVTIRKNTPNTLDPSRKATSSSAFGIVLMNPLYRKTLNAVLSAA